MADEAKLIPICFFQKQSPYNAGEVAGFTPEIAQRYVDAKLAEFYDPERVVPVSGEEVVLNMGGEEKTLSEEEPATAAALAEKAIANDEPQMQTSAEISQAGGRSEESTGGPETPTAGPENAAAGPRKKR